MSRLALSVWYMSHKQGFASSMSLSEEISWLVQSFYAFESFYFLVTIFATDHRHLNVNKNVWNTLHHILHSTQRWSCTQMHPTWKSGWMNQKIFDEKFDRDQTSSNIIKQFLSFFPYVTLSQSLFINFVSSQMYPIFCSTSKIYNVWWNVGCICVGLGNFRSIPSNMTRKCWI